MGGFFSSKGDVTAIESIESNVIKLIFRLRDQEVRIDGFVKQKILKALSVYSNLVEKEEKRGYISKAKIVETRDIISRARSILYGLPTLTPRDIKVDTSKDEMKAYIYDIEKKIKNDKIKQDDYENVFETVTAFSRNLESVSGMWMNRQEEENLSVLFLNLLLKSPIIKVTNVLENSLRHLQAVSDECDFFDIKNVTAFNVEEVRNKLVQIKSKAEEISQEVDQKINHLQQSGNAVKNDYLLRTRSQEKAYSAMVKSSPQNKQERDPFQTKEQNSVSKYENILKEIESSLNECELLAEKLSAPAQDAITAEIKNRVFFLIENQLKKISDVEIEQKTKHLLQKGAEIVEKLKNIDKETKGINEKLRNLKEFEKNALSAVNSNISFEEKINMFQSLRSKIATIDENVNEINIEKTALVNKLEGFIITESMVYLRQLKRSLDYYKTYGKQFAYPTSIDLFENKKQEISNVGQNLNKIPNSVCIENRRQIILRETEEVLKILTQKAEYNEEVLRNLTLLDNISQQIVQINQDFLLEISKLQKFNEFRQELDSIVNFNQKVLKKKMQIRCELHTLEESLYSKKFPEEIREIKALLNGFEKNLQEIISPMSDEMYKKEKHKIVNLKIKVLALSGKYNLTLQETSVISNNVDAVLRFLKNLGKETETKHIRFHYLKNMNKHLAVSCTKSVCEETKLKLIEQQEDKIKKIKFSLKNLDEFKELENIEMHIFTEKSKLKLKIFTMALKQLESYIDSITHPMDTKAFNETINELLDFKESAEDMAEGNSELNTQKKIFLKEVFKVLKLLDPDVADLAFNKKQPENILELQSQFQSFNPETLNISRESLEFIQLINQRAQHFEKYVNCYLGTSSSVDFYVIHENLMRLLEELDKLNCQEELLLNAVYQTVNFIKGLIKQLELNASNE